MSVDLLFPTELTHADGISHSIHEEIFVTQLKSGVRRARTYQERAREIFDFSLVDLRSNSPTDYQRFRRFLHQLRGTLNVFWVLGQVNEQHNDLACGPLGDGSTQCFPVPIFGLDTGTLEVILSGKPQLLTTDYTLRGLANLLDANNACVEDETVYTLSSATAEQVQVISESGLYCCLIEATSTTTNVGLETEKASGIVVGDTYNAVASVLASDDTDTFDVSIMWYTSGDVFISASASTPETVTETGWTQINIEGTAPATAAKAAVRVRRTNSADTHYWVDSIGLIPGDIARFYHPEGAPYLVEFVSAPAVGTRVIASGEGYRLFRGIAKKLIGFTRELEGDTLVRNISMIEDLEV